MTDTARAQESPPRALGRLKPIVSQDVTWPRTLNTLRAVPFVLSAEPAVMGALSPLRSCLALWPMRGGEARSALATAGHHSPCPWRRQDPGMAGQGGNLRGGSYRPGWPEGQVGDKKVAIPASSRRVTRAEDHLTDDVKGGCG